MRKPTSNKLRGAPLASFESFLSLETRLEEGNSTAMRQQWNDNEPGPLEDGDIEEPWASAEFSQLTRRQQNCEIYRVSLSGSYS